jgi:hypothetical protein
MDTRSPAPERVTVRATMAYVLTHPWLVFVIGWNWKTALLSAICRAALWPAAMVGHAKAFSADSLRGFWIEFVFRLAIGGFWGSLLQAFCAARPAWLAGLYLAVLLPGIAICLEFLALQVGGARRAGTITMTSMAFSLISLLVNWGLMRKGMLLTGRGTAVLAGLGSAASVTQENSGGSSA